MGCRLNSLSQCQGCSVASLSEGGLALLVATHDVEPHDALVSEIVRIQASLEYSAATAAVGAPRPLAPVENQSHADEGSHDSDEEPQRDFYHLFLSFRRSARIHFYN